LVGVSTGAYGGQSGSSKEEDIDSTSSYATYLEYNKVLRTWFVAFGIGGPALFLANETLAKRLAQVGLLKPVVALFLAGVAAQVLGAFINKIANWYVHLAYTDDSVRNTRRHHFFE
jgi:hypothetical protein